MIENKQYNIDLDKIKVSFKIRDGGLTHSQGGQFKMLPYVTNEKTLVLKFDGVLGAFSRMASNRVIKGEFKPEELVDNVIQKIGEFEGSESEEILEGVLKDIVNSTFVDKESLVDFDIKTMNYIVSKKEDEKIAGFLYSLLFDEELSKLVSKQYNQSIDNVLYELVLNSLPQLEEKNYKIPKYKSYVPFIKELFIKDFKFIIQDEGLYKKSLQRLLEYYYMFYISQLSMKLDKFEKADLTKPETLYYTLNWEKASKTRKSYKFGWDLLKRSVESLFSHAVNLEILNHHGLEEQLGYTELFDLFNSIDDITISNQINEVCEVYKGSIRDIDWNSFKETENNSANLSFNKAYKLFGLIEHQFNNSYRLGPKQRYENWYVKFVYKNFAKMRGPLGYNLNLNEEDIILMTKICINNNEKLKLNTLFEEFEKRGMFFDKDSKIKIIELYEKLNLLEKKSDSGDAQYVRSVL